METIYIVFTFTILRCIYTYLQSNYIVFHITSDPEVIESTQ